MAASPQTCSRRTQPRAVPLSLVISLSVCGCQCLFWLRALSEVSKLRVMCRELPGQHFWAITSGNMMPIAWHESSCPQGTRVGGTWLIPGLINQVPALGGTYQGRDPPASQLQGRCHWAWGTQKHCSGQSTGPILPSTQQTPLRKGLCPLTELISVSQDPRSGLIMRPFS